MGNEKKPSLFIVVGVILLVLGGLITVGGLLFPSGDVQAIGVGLELQIVGLAIILLLKK